MVYLIDSGIWERFLKLLREMKHLHTRDEDQLRRFIEAVFFMVRSGCQWRLLPLYYGHWRAVHRRFKRWSDRGILEQLMQAAAEPDLEACMMDSTFVRAHACAAGYGKDSQKEEALGRSKGGFTTKIHALVDSLGNPLKFILTQGQRNDITQAENLIQDIAHTLLIADKGYDSNAFLETLEKQNCTSVIPPKINRKIQRSYDKHLYKERHLVECFFSKIKYFRRIFSRFDKSAQTFLGFLHFASTLIWLK
jgi:transposase